MALGVAALVAVGTFAANLDRALSREGSAVLGGDIGVRSGRPLGADGEGALEALRRDGAAVARVREMAAMARNPATGTALLVELKAVEGDYPLYGRLETHPAAPLADLLARRGARGPPGSPSPPILAGLAFSQAGSLKGGAIFLAAAVGAAAGLLGLGRLLALAGGALPRGRRLAWRQGVANLGRPGGHAARVVVALGAGAMALVALALLQAILGRQLDHERRREIPPFSFVEVQPDQREAFARLVADRGTGAPPHLVPVIRARLVALDGQRITRDYFLMYQADPPPGDAITHGRWWTGDEARTRPRASVEELTARRLGVGVGSTLTFDVQGVPVEAEVMSLRKVDWQSFGTNFFVILSPGSLDRAPASFLATARVPPRAEGPLRDAMTAAFPNVIAVPMREIVSGAAAILDHIATAVRAIALFAIGTGLVVMAGVLAASRRQRLYESAILRTLGATRGAVARIFAVEYACLGAAAGFGGSLLGGLLAWIVLRYVLDAPWTFQPAIFAAGIALTTALVLAVGFPTTFRLLGHKPLPVLRQE